MILNHLRLYNRVANTVLPSFVDLRPDFRYSPNPPPEWAFRLGRLRTYKHEKAIRCASRGFVSVQSGYMKPPYK